MRLVEFRGYHSGKISFMLDKIIAFQPNHSEPEKTSIFVLNAGGENDEFIVDTSYIIVRKIVQCAINVQELKSK